MGQFGVGQGIRRFEDMRLLRGQGRYHNDVNLPGQAHAVLVRSPHAHARIRAIDTSAALRAPGVLAVLTGADVARDGLGTMRMTLRRQRPDGSPMFASPHRGLTQDRVRHVGDPVALMIAETPAQAADAAELVDVDYEPLPSVTATAEAAAPGSPPVWDECPDNFTHTNPTAPYRGAGRPEAIYVIERLIDDAARELGVDPVALRRQNLIAPSAMPYRTPLGMTYDCGEFEQSMDAALALADVAGFAARREESRRRGTLRGIAVVNAIERAASPGPEFAELRFNPGGSATIFMGTKNQGQGHETTFKQILHERLGIAPEEVRFIDGDTERVGFGMGTMGSRSTVIGGTALWMAADKVIAKGRKIAARLLEAAEADILFADGRFTVAGTDRAVLLKEVARAAFQPAQLPPGLEPGLYETGTFSPPADTWPNGCHVCEVEIDEATGAVTLCRYIVVDDVGTVINPLTLKGQIHGGVAQGVGQALMEQVQYDPESGQLLTTSFMEYAIPRADDLCDMHIESHPVPTTLNPLGAKGAGEAGTVGALPVVINAVMNALAPLGVRELDMPATSEKVWQAIQAARAARQA